MPHLETSYDLDTYVRDVEEIVSGQRSADETAAAIEALNRRLLDTGFRIPDLLRRVDPQAPYTRNLVHQDPDKRFSVIAMVWGAWQETAVHDHLSWCVMSVFENTCLAVDYDRLDDERDPSFAELSIRSAQVLGPGAVVGLTPPPRSNIHRISNASCKQAVTLHTYGDPGTKARTFDPRTGAVEIRTLAFHQA